MSVLDWILTAILFIVSLGALIVIHELGHFSMAKLFNVYCQEFSIGFGPALIHKRKKGKETYFSLRAVPLGGYVAMYGEDIQLEDGVNIGPERSLEGIKKWKKAIIVSAGIILNAILAFVLIAISNLCFPRIVTTRYASVTANTPAAAYVCDNDKMLSYPFNIIDHSEYAEYEYKDSDKVIHAGQFFIVDNDVTIGEQKYVATYCPVGTKNYTKLIDGIKLYPGIAGENIATINPDKTVTVKDQVLYDAYKGWLSAEGALPTTLYANFKESTYNAGAGAVVNLNLQFLRYDATNKKFSETPYSYPAVLEAIDTSGKYSWNDVGLSFKTMKDESWTFGDRIKQTFKDYGNAATSVFKGLGTLFTGGIKNMSGIVGIFEASATLYGSYTFATYLYFWGMISVNLAIFNLLPFPGLDGWALLVTAIEGATKKKIPSKVKNIVSTVGLCLLFALMIAIVVLDIIKLV